MLSLIDSIAADILSAAFILGWIATVIATVYVLTRGYMRDGVQIVAFVFLMILCWPVALYLAINVISERLRKERQEITDRLDLIAAQLGMLQPPEPRPPQQTPPG